MANSNYIHPSLDLYLLAIAGRWVWQGTHDRHAKLSVDELMVAMDTDQRDIAQAMFKFLSVPRPRRRGAEASVKSASDLNPIQSQGDFREMVSEGGQQRPCRNRAHALHRLCAGLVIRDQRQHQVTSQQQQQQRACDHHQHYQQAVERVMKLTNQEIGLLIYALSMAANQTHDMEGNSAFDELLIKMQAERMLNLSVRCNVC